MEEAAGVGRHALEVAALRFGVEGAEGEGRLARARDAGEDDEGVPGDADVDVLEVVDPGAGGVSLLGMLDSIALAGSLLGEPGQPGVPLVAHVTYEA
jgi:hypothetical protein